MKRNRLSEDLTFWIAISIILGLTFIIWLLAPFALAPGILCVTAVDNWFGISMSKQNIWIMSFLVSLSAYAILFFLISECDWSQKLKRPLTVINIIYILSCTVILFGSKAILHSQSYGFVKAFVQFAWK
jgi:hypothetical protein